MRLQAETLNRNTPAEDQLLSDFICKLNLSLKHQDNGNDRPRNPGALPGIPPQRRITAGNSAIMAEFGYGPEKLAEGQTVLASARAGYDTSRTEKNETKAAYHAFETKKDALAARYAMD